MEPATLIIWLVIILIVIVVITVIFALNSTTNVLLVPAALSRKAPPSDWLIPKRIYQTQEFEYVPSGMREAMQSIIDLNPDFGYKYYSDQRARTFMVKHMDARTVRAFDILIPGAYRADLFRYALLYVKGGVYIDSSMLGVVPLAELIQPTDTFIAPVDTPSPNIDGHCLGIYNAFMGATPRHPILRQILDLILARIDARDIGYNPLCMAGPLALGEIFAESYGVDELKEMTYADGVRLINHTPGSVRAADRIILYTKYTKYRLETKHYNSGEHYGKLWQRGEVFAPEPPEIPLGFSYKPFCPNGIGWDSNAKSFPAVDPSQQLTVPIQKVQPSTHTLNQLIPAIIHQTHEFDQVPSGMRAAMDTIIKFNPGYEHIYYNGDERRQFILTHMDTRAVKCYDSLIPGTYQSDFFRYAVLYYQGGVYMDAGFEALRGLSGIIDPTNQYVGAVDNCGNNVYTAFIGAVPQHPILGKALELMLDRIEKREYGPSDLWITGPRLLRDAFTAVVGQPVKEQSYKDGIKLIRYKIDSRCSSGVIKAGEIHYFNNKYPSYRLDMSWYCPSENYAVLWAERRVFRK